jgi:hypothetical protein
MLVFFDIRGIVHHEFAPEGHTMNAQFYCSVLHRLTEDIRRKRPELWRAGNWLLHDDNAPSPSSCNAWVSRSQQHYHTSASTLLTRFGPLRLFPLPKDEAAAQGSPLWQSGGDPAGIAECSW